jgi:ABC-type hemin transport system ATPase subunit
MEKLETEASRLAKHYLRLGGTRKAIIDDNRVSTRSWDPEPEEASRFWDECIAPLDDKHRREVETLLPTVNAQ